MSQPLVYVAGAFSGRNGREVHLNVERAEAAALEVLRHGGAPICPHSLGRTMVGVLPEKVWLDAGLEMLRVCDAMLVCAGWQQSKGTLAEIAFAGENDIPYFFTIKDLYKWKVDNGFHYEFVTKEVA